jgi:hypothetical protein
MNVFYRGLANPVEVSVPGVDPSQLQVSASGGSLSSKGGGNFEFTPPADGGEGIAEVSVTATINGKSVSMGKKPFVVKPLPRPVAMFANVKSTESSVPMNCKGASTVQAFMDDDFVFQGIDVKVVGFTMTISGTSKRLMDKVTGSGTLSPKLRGALALISPGDLITITDIKYTTNGAKEKSLSSIAFTVK